MEVQGEWDACTNTIPRWQFFDMVQDLRRAHPLTPFWHHMRKTTMQRNGGDSQNPATFKLTPAHVFDGDRFAQPILRANPWRAAAPARARVQGLR